MKVWYWSSEDLWRSYSSLQDLCSGVTGLVLVVILWLVFEWAFFMQYYMNYWSMSSFIFPYKLPFMLMFNFVYWCVIWGMSVWSSSLHGKFTSGDSKLWNKGFASFWVIEFSTMMGMYLAICWMSWGPIMFMPSNFMMQKRGFIFEFTMFTYMLWMAYLLSVSLKWSLYTVQVVLAALVMFFLSLLIWSDFSTLFNSEVISISMSSKWSHVNMRSLMYSLSDNWWCYHFMGDKSSVYSFFSPMEAMSSNLSQTPFNELPGMSEYESYNWLPIFFSDEFFSFGFLGWFLEESLSHLYNLGVLGGSIYTADDDLALDSFMFFPSQIGFLPKSLAMWYLLVVLKMWHHLMLVLWWLLYLLSVKSYKKGSYSLLSVCYFNIYCCFLMCLLVYCFQYLQVWESVFSMKPNISSYFQNVNILKESLDYCVGNFFGSNSHSNNKNVWYLDFYSLGPPSLLDYHYNFEAQGMDIFYNTRYIGVFS